MEDIVRLLPSLDETANYVDPFLAYIVSKTEYSLPSPCGHLAITDIPITEYGQQLNPWQINYRRLTEVNSRY